MIRTTPRTARKQHYCDRCERHSIRPGDRYLSIVIAPHTDFVNEGPHWSRHNECRTCVTRRSHAHLIEAAR